MIAYLTRMPSFRFVSFSHDRCVVLISGFVIFKEDFNATKLMGTALAFIGVLIYR
jgi:hypothetical protein